MGRGPGRSFGRRRRHLYVLIVLPTSFAIFRSLYFSSPFHLSGSRPFPLFFLHNEIGHALIVSTLALSSWMASHNCNVVFGNHHGLFPENSRAQIHSVRSMPSNINLPHSRSDNIYGNANFSFHRFCSVPLSSSFDLPSTRPQNVRKAVDAENAERIRQEEEDEDDKKDTTVGRIISVVSHA